jgi:hypothetical protein
VRDSVVCAEWARRVPLTQQVSSEFCLGGGGKVRTERNGHGSNRSIAPSFPVIQMEAVRLYVLWCRLRCELLVDFVVLVHAS